METRGSKKNKWDGCSFGGKSLNSYFEEEKEKEVKQELKNDIREQKKKRKRIYVKTKYRSNKQGGYKMATNIPQNQINIEYLKRFVEQSKGIKQQITCLLLSGDKYTAGKIIEYLSNWKKYSKQQIWNTTSAIMRSEFSNYIERKKVMIGGAKQYEYWCNEAGCLLTPQEAHELVRSKKGASGHRADPKVATLFEKQKEKQEETPDTNENEDINEDMITEEIIDKLAKQTQTLNVIVTGAIDINFNFKLGS